MEIYKLVYQYSHNSSLKNTKNRENLAPYSKLENSHKYVAAKLSIPLYNCCNTYILFIPR